MLYLVMTFPSENKTTCNCCSWDHNTCFDL